MIIKFIQFFFKFLATIFSKLGAQSTYTKLYKLLMRYKIITWIYSPLKIIFNNLVYFIKLASAIIAILSLFNISLLYYNFDILNEANNLINSIINWFKDLYYSWFPSEDDEEIQEPVDFFQSKNKGKVIKKVVEQPKTNYWILPLILIGYGTLYYFNPHINLEEIINPVLNKIECKLPDNFPITFVTGTFIYKFFAISISYITGYRLSGDDSNSNDRPSNSNEINSNESEFRSRFSLPDSYVPNSSEPQPIVYNHMDNLSEDEQDEFNELFPNDNEQTPRISNTNLPNTSNTHENRPLIGENPFIRTRWMRQIDANSVEIRVEDW